MQPKGVVFEGKTLDEAVRKGMEALGLSRAEVMITVLEEGSGGFLGLGARPYRVRMMPRPARQMSERPSGPPREGRGERESRGGRDRRSGRGDGGRREGRGGRSEGRGDGRGGRRDSREERGAGRESRGSGRSREPVANNRSSAPQSPREAPAGHGGGAEAEGRGRRRRRRGERGGNRELAPRTTEQPSYAPLHEHEPVAVASPRVADDNRAMNPAPQPTNGMSAADLESSACRATEDLLRAMGFNATVSARVDGDTAEVRAEVPDQSDLLVGPKGEVRQALQHLLNRMLNRGGGSRYHLQLEINDFWQQREDELRTMALGLAEQAVADGTEKLTEYLNSQERRVVHMSLRDHPGVTTHAIGDGLIKKIAITPGGEPEGSPDGE
jgi:spoIIIJ-associated protein